MFLELLGDGDFFGENGSTLRGVETREVLPGRGVAPLTFGMETKAGDFWDNELRALSCRSSEIGSIVIF